MVETAHIVSRRRFEFHRDLPALTIADILDLVRAAHVTGQITINISQGSVAAIELMEQSKLLSLENNP